MPSGNTAQINTNGFSTHQKGPSHPTLARIMMIGRAVYEESIKEFQSDMGLEVTGVIGLADLTCAVEAALDVNTAQKIYNYLSEYKLLQSKLSVSKEKEKRRNNRLLIIGCIIAFIFFMIGAFTFYGWLKELIINLVRTYI